MKKILLSLFVSLIGFICFGNCVEVGFNTNSNWTRAGSNFSISLGADKLFCATRNNSNITNCSINGITLGNLQIVCIYNDSSEEITISSQCNGMTSSRTVDYWILNGNAELTSSCPLCPTCPTCPDPYSSLQCQTEYNLIPVDSVDSEYCENNNLCPVYTGEVSTGYSTLYINDIRHQSMPFIYLNIPEEFNRTYSTGINDFTIDVEGYNVDTEYIDGIIRTQNYKPSSEDFTNLVGLLAPYTKYLVFLLFVFVLWAWIKNSFKSKKL